MTESELGRWPLRLEVPVAWGDMDALGHVNNTVYLRWFESARIRYFERIAVNLDLSSHTIGPILARQEIDYRQPVTYPDRVSTAVTVSRIGRTSFIMPFRSTSEKTGAVVAEGQGVMVMLDYAHGQTVPVPDEVRAAILALEMSAERP